MEDLSKVVVQEDFSYGPHELQTLTVYHPVGSSHNEDGYFLIYIHGGAWRDPLLTPSQILPTLTTLLSSPPPTPFTTTIRAVASLSYRLSPHPSFPQDPPPTTPSSAYRDAKHPDHLLDILSGIGLLQHKFGFGSRYVLMGHSCGATLALQTFIRQTLLAGLDFGPGSDLDGVEESLKGFVEPEIVIGVAGIYDLSLLRNTNSHPAYQSFIAGAFGPDEKIWDVVSPALFTPPTQFWPNGKLLVLVTSSGDDLIDESQIDVMGKKAETWRERREGLQVQVWKGMLGGGHDEIWSGGKSLAAVVERAIGNSFT